MREVADHSCGLCLHPFAIYYTANRNNTASSTTTSSTTSTTSTSTHCQHIQRFPLLRDRFPLQLGFNIGADVGEIAQ